MMIQEPQASIIASGMERFASDELERICDVARYWQRRGLVFKKGKRETKNG